MERGNVLVIGNSGVGKSTLINAVLGENKAKTGWGTEGTTGSLEIYESEEVPFRVIDTIGFEPSFIKEHIAINAVKKWSKAATKKGNKDTQINMIWFCVDGCARKLFSKAIKDLSRATAMWKSVPVIVVITKSYAELERAENIEMVNNAFANQKKYAKKLKKVMPVVASTYTLNESSFAAPYGISELIDVTNELMPEGIKAAESDISDFILNRKRALAHSVVGVATAGAATVGAVPIPFPDAAILAPLEGVEINSIARIYGIKEDDASKDLLNTIIEVGTVSIAAKAAINGLKAIPGINIGAAAINAIIAGGIVAAIGEGAIHIFEQIYKGEKSIEDIEWVKKFMEEKLSKDFIEKVTNIIKDIAKSGNKNISKILPEVMEKAFNTNNE